MQGKKIKVWDPAVRLFHGGLALVIAGAFLTAEDDDTTHLHARIGLGLVALLVFRVIWGFIGSPHARFSAFVKGPRAVLAYGRALLRGRAPLHLSHNPLGATMVVVMMTVLAITGVSGLLVYLGPEFEGPLSPWLPMALSKGIAELHEATAWASTVLIALHVVGVIVSSVLERQNLPLAMITGMKRAPEGVPEARPASPRRARLRPVALVSSLLLATAVTVMIALLFPARAEAAAPQQSLLEQYAAEAKADNPSFTGFDAKRGQALYVGEHTKDGKPVSCQTCHMADPTKPGKSPAGKVIEPLAPSAAPERFTARKKADKWFDRNCKQVFGRPCAAEEKGHLLQWLLTF